jgi:hypothetical protein
MLESVAKHLHFPFGPPFSPCVAPCEDPKTKGGHETSPGTLVQTSAGELRVKLIPLLFSFFLFSCWGLSPLFLFLSLHSFHLPNLFFVLSSASLPYTVPCGESVKLPYFEPESQLNEAGITAVIDFANGNLNLQELPADAQRC